jgi:hypothetical protein
MGLRWKLRRAFGRVFCRLRGRHRMKWDGAPYFDNGFRGHNVEAYKCSICFRSRWIDTKTQRWGWPHEFVNGTLPRRSKPRK